MPELWFIILNAICVFSHLETIKHKEAGNWCNMEKLLTKSDSPNTNTNCNTNYQKDESSTSVKKAFHLLDYTAAEAVVTLGWLQCSLYLVSLLLTLADDEYKLQKTKKLDIKLITEKFALDITTPPRRTHIIQSVEQRQLMKRRRRFRHAMSCQMQTIVEEKFVNNNGSSGCNRSVSSGSGSTISDSSSGSGSGNSSTTVEPHGNYENENESECGTVIIHQLDDEPDNNSLEDEYSSNNISWYWQYNRLKFKARFGKFKRRAMDLFVQMPVKKA